MTLGSQSLLLLGLLKPNPAPKRFLRPGVLTATTPAILQAQLKCHLLQEVLLVSPTELVLTGLCHPRLWRLVYVCLPLPLELWAVFPHP